MQTDWAAENLQVIRTLMERSALYRRALGPVMICAGLLGLAGALIPFFRPIDSSEAFTAYWMVIALTALVKSLLLVRSQALKEAEAFWSPPARRVSLAVLPSFVIGALAGVFLGVVFPQAGWALAPVWVISYGCGLHAAGFFMRRGIRLFGWICVLGGIACLVAMIPRPLPGMRAGHCVMGLFFGVAHLAFGIYLRATERNKSAA